MPETEITSIDLGVQIFLECQKALAQGTLIHRASRQDKEFHFQNCFEERLKEARISLPTVRSQLLP